MSEHAELLKEARGLASRLDYMNTGAKLIPRNAATMIRTLADLVEQQDTALAETVAACKTCDEAITQLFALEDSAFLGPVPTSREWFNLRAARHLARRAAEPAEPIVFRDSTLHVHSPKPKGDVDVELETGTCRKCGKTYEYTEAWVGPYCSTDCGRTPDERAAYETRMQQLRICAKAEKTLAEATVKHGDLLERLADGETNQPPKPSAHDDLVQSMVHSEQPSRPTNWGRYYELLDIMTVRELSPTEQVEYDEFLAILKQLGPGIFPPKTVPPFTLEEDCPAPPVEVEMRTVEAPGGWLPEYRLDDLWYPIGAQGLSYTDRGYAQAIGATWLAALSEQLGVRLVAAWTVCLW